MTVTHLVFASAVAALALSQPAAHAAEAPPSIAACVDQAQTIDAMHQCKRIVYKPCVKEPDHLDATHGMVMCNDREGTQWTALLANRTADLKKRDAYRAKALDAANKAWRGWIDQECNYHRAEAMGGSAEQVITTECISDMTADRVILLTWQLRGNTLY